MTYSKTDGAIDKSLPGGRTRLVHEASNRAMELGGLEPPTSWVRFLNPFRKAGSSRMCVDCADMSAIRALTGPSA